MNHAQHILKGSDKFSGNFWLSLGILVCRVLYYISIILLLLVIGLSLCNDFASLYRWICQTVKIFFALLGVMKLGWFKGNSIFSNGLMCQLGLFYLRLFLKNY